jgi:hypothetical protein
MKQGAQASANDNEVIEYGCYALCVIEMASRDAGKDITVREAVDYIHEAKKTGVIGDECYVNNAAELYNAVYGERVYRKVLKKPVSRSDTYAAGNDAYIICNKKPMYTHFTLCYRGAMWDPLPPLRSGAAAYKPDSYRILA